MDVMRDPVKGTDGHTYERDAIVQALATKPVSPLTRQPMTAASLEPNHVLRAEIEQWQPQMTIPSFVPLTQVCIQSETAPRRINTSQPKMDPCLKAFYITFIVVTFAAIFGFLIYFLVTAVGLPDTVQARNRYPAPT